jgi:hypothetical protein
MRLFDSPQEMETILSDFLAWRASLEESTRQGRRPWQDADRLLAAGAD